MPKPKPVSSTGNTVSDSGQNTNLSTPEPINAEAIRATGPFASGRNAAYAQNLATYAGGAFNHNKEAPTLVNPFNANPFASVPRGLGTSPLPGTPNTLLNVALGTTLTNPVALNSLFPGFTPTQLGSMGIP